MKQKLAIVGSGIAGLTAAWLLEEKYDITLFEKEGNVGGHASSFQVEYSGKIYSIDYLFHIFSTNYHYFNSLLTILKVPKKKIKFTVNFINADKNLCYPLPLLARNANLSNRLSLTYIRYILKLRRFTKLATQLDSYEITLAEFANQLDFCDEQFKQEFLYVIFSTMWVTSVSKIQQVSAKMLAEFVFNNNLHDIFMKDFFQVADGCASYISKLMDELQTVTIKTHCPVKDIEQTDGKWLINCDEGSLVFDKLIIATSANQASKLFSDAQKEVKTILQQFTYDETKIYIHSDDSYQKYKQKNWAKYTEVYTASNDYVFSVAWQGAIDNIPIFSTSRAQDGVIKHDKIYASFTAEHPLINAAAIRAREKIKSMQTANNLCFVGGYLSGDCYHESAIQSAINVVKLLCPDSKKMHLLNSHIQTDNSMVNKIKKILNIFLGFQADHLIWPLVNLNIIGNKMKKLFAWKAKMIRGNTL